MSTPHRIGFIGLGMMGQPMTACLAKADFALYLLDADTARAEQLAGELKANLLNEGNAAQLDVLITMLPSSKVVEQVLEGNGWAARLARGATVIDMSSSEPARSRALGERLQAAGLGYLDAPVSGGVKRAIAGSLAILAGGDAELLQRCLPLLECMGSSVLHIGPAGAGHAAKALNNYVSAAGLVATVEALHVAERFGIAPQVMVDVLNASSGRSNTSENKAGQFMLSGSYASGFSLQLMDKDLNIAMALAEALGYPMPLGKACTALWDAAAEHATARTDHTEMYRLLAAKE
ncbi:NAD-binding protein [Pseudomonas sp. NPDC007930]|uniref:NAD(P)-dependent oxidoreductase n=1 Tax=Pseudomonas sp. NPDC007930 TaxID=3364417 RepID=UPI0036ED585F